MSDSLADAAANALLFGDNLEESLDKIAKSAASSMLSSLFSYAGKTFGSSMMGESNAGGVTGSTGQMTPEATGFAGDTSAGENGGQWGGGQGGAMGGYFPGYATGGYTGTRGMGDVAGVVHGQEFVINKNATARHRATLEAMNAGKAAPDSGMKVTVNNYAGVEVQTNQLSRGEVEVMIRQGVHKEAPNAVANSIRNPNSSVSKAMNNAVEAPRRRL